MDDSTRDLFCERVAGFVSLAEDGLCPIPAKEVSQQIDEYFAGGIRPVHHSATYRALHHPHYRVVALNLLSAELVGLLSEENHE
ncbi:MAG: hypothetical protein MZU97_23585 [Bacillus subtilis]|nr:hypothetical protein [Bacillus subtilis]